jgi:diguanylate cyclase (GGDEF)-like protein
MRSEISMMWLSAALAAGAAASLAWTVAVRRHRSARLWPLALLAPAGGAALGAALPDSAWALGAAHALLLAWPGLLLSGLRRFHARVDWPASRRLDSLVAGVAFGLALVAAVLPPEFAAPALALAVLGAHLYPAALLLGAPSRADAPLLRMLAAAMTAAALLPLTATADPSALLPPRALANALAALVSAFVVLLLASARTERQLRESRRRLRVLANIDPLTRIPNRRHFQELSTAVIEQDPPGSAALVMFDIDHFKRINDRLGHAEGDRALRRVAEGLQHLLRARDVAGRHGGDEFSLLLRHSGPAEAIAVAERLVRRLQRTQSEQGPLLSLSFGIVQVGAGEALDEALRRADQALYEAKRQGRSRAVAASGDELQPVFGESQRLGLTHC